MARNATAKSAPAPEMVSPASVSETINGVIGETVLTARKEPVDLPRQPSSARNPGPVISKKTLWTQIDDDTKSRVELKFEVIRDVAQTLSHAADLYSEGDTKAKEAGQIADKAAVRLYQGRAAGVLTAEDVSQLLRDQFGAQQKGARTVKVSPTDPLASKTPYGQGEVIRKRIVRAANAYDYLEGRSDDRFFAGLTAESSDKDGTYTLGDVIDRLSNGSLSIYSAYDYLAAIKAAHQERTNPAFDPKKVAALVQALSEEGAADIVRNSSALTLAYAELVKALDIIGEMEDLKEAA